MFRINGKVFYGTLAYLDKVIEEDCVLPVLSSYLILPGEGHIRMVASDTETTISVRLQAVTKGTDSPFLVNAKRFTKTMKEMPDEDIEFEMSESTLAYKWTTGNGALGIETDTEPFPLPEEEKDHRELTLPASVLSSSIGHVLYAASKDESKPALCGVHFCVEPGKIDVAASDAHIIAADSIRGLETRYDADFTIGIKSASIIKKITSKTNVEMSVACGEKKATFVVGNFEVSVRLVSDRYPNYKSIIQKAVSSSGSEVCLEKEDLAAMVRRVAVSSDTLTNVITLSLSENCLKASCFDFSSASSADDTLECGYFGDSMTVNLSAKRLVPLLENFPGGKLRIRFGGKETPVVMRQGERDTEEDGAVSMAALMPLMQ